MANLTVTGEVTRVFHHGKGVAITESFEKRDGTIGNSYYTAWFEDDSGLQEGDYGKFSGLFSIKVDNWEDKKTGEPRTGYTPTMNNTRFEYESDEGGSSDDWASGADSDDGPF